MQAFHDVINALSFGLNIIGSLVILFGVVLALMQFLRKEILERRDAVKLNEPIRGMLGSYLILGLEFFIAGDVIKTIITPTWETLGMLSVIVIIRTILSYFLTRDLRK